MNKGIYSRGYLPHWDFKNATQGITFRLADSVPMTLVKQWRRELLDLRDEQSRQKELHQRIARYEDLGHGDAFLIRADCSDALQQTLTGGHPDRYRLIDWCIMPNHVHVLIQINEGSNLGGIIRSWKGTSSFIINGQLGRTGPLWQREYHDRLVRDLNHFQNCRAYIRNNPVKAKLCEKPEDWKFSSAGMGWSAE